MRLGRCRDEPGIPFEEAARWLPTDPVVVEAGAASGDDVIAMKRLWPAATVHAFEPEPDTFALLQRRVHGIDRVTAWNMALGGKDGEGTLHVSDGPYGALSSSLLEPRTHLDEMPDVTFNKSTPVTQRTLDSWAAGNQVGRIDLLALDLQGMEQQVLAAAPCVLGTVRAVICEVFTNEKFAGCGTITDLQQLLINAGFVVLRTNMYWGNSGDMLAVRAGLLG